ATKAEDVVARASIAVGSDTVDHALRDTFADHAADDQLRRRAATLLCFFTQVGAGLGELVRAHPDGVVGVAKTQGPLQRFGAAATYPDRRPSRAGRKDKGGKAYELAFVGVDIIGKQGV